MDEWMSICQNASHTRGQIGIKWESRLNVLSFYACALLDIKKQASEYSNKWLN